MFGKYSVTSTEFVCAQVIFESKLRKSLIWAFTCLLLLWLWLVLFFMLNLIISGVHYPLHWIKLSQINWGVYNKVFQSDWATSPILHIMWVHVNTAIVYVCVKEKKEKENNNKKKQGLQGYFWNFMHQLTTINWRRDHEHSNNSWEEVLSPAVIRQPLPSHRSLVKLRSSGRFPLWWTGVSGRSHDIWLLWQSRNMTLLTS